MTFMMPPLTPIRLFILAAILSGSWAAWKEATTPPPLAQIVAPGSRAKLRSGGRVPVTIRVGGAAQVSWVLLLGGAGTDATTLAHGTAPVTDATVAEIDPAGLIAGGSYTLTLTATDHGGTATAATTFLIPDSHYILIPLEEGNLSQRGYSIRAVDGLGNQVIYSSAYGDPAPITLLHRQTGKRDVLLIPLDSTESFKFSGDGARLFFTGYFNQGGFVYHGLGFLDLGSGTYALVAQLATFFYNLDDTGRRVAGQAATGSGPSGEDIRQYFLYDEATGETRQLTNDPAAIAFTGDCPAQFGTTPLISADGGTVVVITHATLGIVPEDPSIGCRIFSYDVAAREIRLVAALPKSMVHVDIPALSANGRWLSFVFSGASGGVSALMDVHSGDMTVPVVDVGNFTSFDSAVTRDGDAVIVSTEADIDARVGNADHNLELFYYDRATGQATQITETLAGIGQTPGGCESYRPSVSHDGGVLVFAFQRISVESCHLDGLQRNEADGFAFGFVRAVRKRPGNTDVVLDSVSDQRVVSGDTLALPFTAHDADGDPVSFFAQVKDGDDVPAGSTISDHHDGTATFEWPTKPEDTGDHVLRVAAFDEGGGEMFQDVTISVVPHGIACVGDCNRDQQVTIDELLSGVGIALGTLPPSACAAYDHVSTPVTIDELLVAVDNALTGCAGAGGVS